MALKALDCDPWVELTVLRKLAGFSQTDFSALTGISKQLQSNLETGWRKPTDKYVANAAKVLGVPRFMLEPRRRCTCEQGRAA